MANLTAFQQRSYQLIDTSKEIVHAAISIGRVELDHLMRRNNQNRPSLKPFTCLYVNPADVRYIYRGLTNPPFTSPHSYKKCFYSEGDWDLHVSEFITTSIYHSTYERYIRDVSWDKTPEFQRMLNCIAHYGVEDGCRTYDDLMARFARLDRFVAEIVNTNRLKSQRELYPYFHYREYGGLEIGIGRRGELIKLSGGLHRLAIAKVFNLPFIPVCPILVHEDFSAQTI